MVLQAVTVADFKDRLLSKLGVDLPMNRTSEAWARKLPDMKMLAAHLFPEHLSARHRFWGYADLDLVWGNFSRFAHWFSGAYKLVKTHAYPHGPAQFFANERRFIEYCARCLPCLPLAYRIGAGSTWACLRTTRCCSRRPTTT